MVGTSALEGERSWRAPAGLAALAALAIGTAGPLIDAELGGRWVGSPVDTVGVAVVGFLVGAWLRAAAAGPACLLGALALTVANQRVEPGRYTFVNDYIFFALVIGATALAGALIGGRRRQVRELRRLGAVRQSQLADELSTAQLDERLRLETEVTQAVMQRMSALVVQASGARLLPPGESVRTAAAGMEQAARAVAEDLRETVGSLRAPIDPFDPVPRAGSPAPSTARLGWTDVLVAASGLPLAVEVLTGADVRGPLMLNLLLATAVGVPLLWRRRRPLPSLIGLLALAVLISLTLTPLGRTASILLPVSLAAFTVGAHTRRWARLVGVVVLATGATAIEAIGRLSTLGPSELVPSVVWLAVAVLSGVVAGHQATRATELQELLALTEAGSGSRLRLALAEQRQAVARDLHDGLALAVTVITLQAQAVQRSRDQTLVATALGTIETSTRDAMAQLRAGLASLETSEPTELDAEISAFAAWLGVRLSLQIDAATAVPQTERPLVRRIIRESLINIARHAPGADVEVSLGRQAHRLVVEVIDSGAARPDDVRLGTGTGLLGLAEAVQQHGGRLEQGRTSSGGFRVAAQVPIATQATVKAGRRRLLRAGSVG